MNRHVNANVGRLSPPQRRSLEILDRITETAPPAKGADAAADEVGPECSLLVLCTALRVGGKNAAGSYPNLTVKKTPRQVLTRCEWGHDDYSLQVENLPQKPAEPGQQQDLDL